MVQLCLPVVGIVHYEFGLKAQARILYAKYLTRKIFCWASHVTRSDGRQDADTFK